jgi:hypothetical protein
MQALPQRHFELLGTMDLRKVMADGNERGKEATAFCDVLRVTALCVYPERRASYTIFKH